MRYRIILIVLTLSTITLAADPEETLTGIESLKRSLDLRAKALDAKDAELKRREREINDKESLLSQQLARYEKRFQEMRTIASRSEPTRTGEEKFRRIYEKMDARKIARVLEDADVSLAAEVLGEMRPQIAAEILGRMSNEKVRLLTEKYLSKRLPDSQRAGSSTSDRR